MEDAKDYPEFTPLDAHTVHRAMVEALHQAKEREERMPTSAEAIRRHAAALKIVRDKILTVLPASERRNYQGG